MPWSKGGGGGGGGGTRRRPPRRYPTPTGETPSQQAVPSTVPATKESLAGTGQTQTPPAPQHPYTPRYTPTAPTSILNTFSDLITPGPSARETAEAAARLGVKPQQVAQNASDAASSLINTVATGVKNLTQDAAELPHQRVHSFMGHKTLGTPTLGQLTKAFAQKQVRVNRKGKVTTPQTRRAARGLAAARQAVRKSTGGDGSVESAVGRYLLQHGFNRKAAAGILGNAYAESSFQTGATGYGGGGLWGFTAHPNSLSDLQAFAASQGKPWTNPAVQTQFLLQHVSPTLVRELNAAPTPQAAAATFMQQFERPGIPRQDVREQAAQQAFTSGSWSQPSQKALSVLAAAKQQAQKLGIPTKAAAGDIEREPGSHVVYVRADAKGFVQWAKALLGTQEGSRLQLKWAGEAGISAAAPWCAAFITAGILRRGMTPPPGSANSQSWMTWNEGTNIGTDISKAKPGDIIVIGAGDHIGLYVGGGKMIAGNWSNEVAEYAVAEDTRGVEGIIRPHFKGGKVAVQESAILPGAGIGPAGEIVSGPAGAGGAEGQGGGQGSGVRGTAYAASLTPLNPLLATNPLTPGTNIEEPEGGLVQAILRRRRL